MRATGLCVSICLPSPPLSYPPCVRLRPILTVAPTPSQEVGARRVCLSFCHKHDGIWASVPSNLLKKDVMVIKDALLNVGKCSAVFNFFKIKLFSLTSIKKTTFHPCLFIGFLFSHSDNLYRV